MYIQSHRRIPLWPCRKLVFNLIFFLVAGLTVMNSPSHFVQKESISQNPSDKLPLFPTIPIAGEDLSQKDKKYDPIIKADALRYAIDPLLIKAIIHVDLVLITWLFLPGDRG